MLPDGAFLRRLPAILNKAQVVQVEALVFSSDAVSNCFNTIRQIALLHREKICEAPHSVRQRLFIEAWTIVDCIHVAIQVLKALDYQTPQAIAFMDKYNSARVLRNKMDHLTGNAWNISHSKNQSPPFGAICYLCVSESDLVREGEKVEVSSVGSIMLTAGRFEGPQSLSLINPSGLQFPVCGFKLEAFNIELDLEQAQGDLFALMAEINEKFEMQISELAETISRDKGIPKEKLMAFGGSGFCFYFEFQSQPGAKDIT